jgi:cell division protein FtsI (penicillin-binding protein 3)
VFDVLRRSGLGELIGTGLPGETSGYIDNAQLRYPVVRAAMSYGYGLSTTPLQLAHAYLTLATLGERLPLSVLKSTPGGASVTRVFDRDIVQEVLAMMEMVTAPEGTAPGAAVRGYRVAGKTGTARMVGPDGYDDERHAAWFAGSNSAPTRAPSIDSMMERRSVCMGLLENTKASGHTARVES